MRPLKISTAVKIEPGHTPCPLCGRTFFQPFTELELVKRVRRDIGLEGGAAALSRRIGLGSSTLRRMTDGEVVSVDAWLRLSRYYQEQEHQHAPLQISLGRGPVTVQLHRSAG
jgi:hypothetical protein